jgi:hypothetical protein
MAQADVIRDMADTIVFLLRSTVPPMVDQDRIFAVTPDEFEDLQNTDRPTITVFLYRVAVNSEMRNSPRRILGDGRVTRPLLPLELYYMITPWARETRDEFRIIGRILQVLYDRAEIGPADLQGTSWSQGDSVQLVLDSLPVEDHYRIWETTDLPYRLSLTYIARVVGIEPEVREVVPVVTSARFTNEVA